MLTGTRIREGVWEGVLTDVGAALPEIVVSHMGAALGQAECTERPAHPGSFRVTFEIPLKTLSDGVQTFILSDAETGERLAHFTIVAGEVLDDDLRAEITLLRAELDMLKHAFRRHCVETS